MYIRVYSVGKKLKRSCQIVSQFILFGKKCQKGDFKENTCFDDANYLHFKHTFLNIFFFEISVKYI